MTIPYRGTTGDGTYFITASTWEKKGLLQSERMAKLFMEVLFHYQKQAKYHLHEFVIMPNHFHALITPLFPVTLEKAVQFIKGGFSYRVKKELSVLGEIWQTSFYDHRVRDANEYARFRLHPHESGAARSSARSRGVSPQFGYSDARRSTSVAKASRSGRQ